MTNNVANCPHCGAEEGYYVKFQVTGWSREFFSFDGSEAENGEMWNMVNTRYSKKAHCITCDKEIKELYGQTR